MLSNPMGDVARQILAAVARGNEPDAAAVRQALPDLSARVVYRTLGNLKAAGYLERSDAGHYVCTGKQPCSGDARKARTDDADEDEPLPRDTRSIDETIAAAATLNSIWAIAQHRARV